MEMSHIRGWDEESNDSMYELFGMNVPLKGVECGVGEECCIEMIWPCDENGGE